MTVIKDGKFEIRLMYICPYESCWWSGYYDQEEIDEHLDKHLEVKKAKSNKHMEPTKGKPSEIEK